MVCCLKDWSKAPFLHPQVKKKQGVFKAEPCIKKKCNFIYITETHVSLQKIPSPPIKPLSHPPGPHTRKWAPHHHDQIPQPLPGGHGVGPTSRPLRPRLLPPRLLHSLSDSGHLHTLVSDPLLPPNSTVLGVAVDSLRRRLLAVVHTLPPSPPFDALAAYDLTRPPPLPRLFLSHLPAPAPAVANDVAVDPLGNAYVSNSAGNFIWKVDADGRASVFSNSSLFRSHPIYADYIAPACGLNGIVAHDGYILAVQSNTGKIYKIDGRDGAASVVAVGKDLVGADGIAMRSDGALVVVSYYWAWFLRGVNGWDEAVVFDEIALDAEKFATGVEIREGKRAYVLYGHLDEGMMGNVDRADFSVEEVESERERQREWVWVVGLVGFALAYFFFWRFQMGRLVKDLNKKRL